MARPDPRSLRHLPASLLLPWLLAGLGLPASAAEDAQMLRRRELFTDKAAPPCEVCHTLAAAGSEGQVGPVLDDLKPDAARVRRVLQGGMGVMPSYAGKLDAADMDALAQFVARSASTVKP